MFSGQFPCFSLGEKVFFLSKYSGETDERDKGLNVARSLHDALLFRRDAHGTAGKRPKGVDAACSIRLQGGAWQLAIVFGKLVNVFVGPLLEQWSLPETGGSSR